MISLKCTYDFETELTDVVLTTQHQCLFLSKLSEDELFDLECDISSLEKQISSYRQNMYSKQEGQ